MQTHIKLWIVGAAFSYVPGHAQNVEPAILNANGGSALIAGNTYEWSAGEMTLVSTFRTTDLIVTQGLLQPLNGPASIEKNDLSSAQFSVYPVPTEHMLMLEPHFATGGKLQWVLYDTHGKQLRSRSVFLQSGTEIQTLDLGMLPSAHYFLRVRFESPAGPKYASYTVQKL